MYILNIKNSASTYGNITFSLLTIYTTSIIKFLNAEVKTRAKR